MESKGSVQGLLAHKRGEARVLWPSKEQVEQVEREDEYQHRLHMNNMKMIKTNVCWHHKAGVGIWEVRQRKQQINPGKKVTLESQHFIYFRFMWLATYLLKARFLLKHQSFLQDVRSSFSSRLPFPISFLLAFSKTNRFTSLSYLLLALYSKAAIWGVQAYSAHFSSTTKQREERETTFLLRNWAQQEGPASQRLQCLQTKSQLRSGMVQLHRETAQSQQPTLRLQKVRWKENSSVSEESVQHSLLFRAIKLPRSKHLLNRQSGLKSTKVLYSFFSFPLIYLLWGFWIY